MNEDAPRDGNYVPAALFQIDGQARGQLMAGQIDQATGRILVDTPGGSGGTVTSFSFTDGNGFDGTVTNPTTTPNLSLAITVTGIILGAGGALTAASASTDYAAVAFKTISVSGQSDVVADSPIDTLTLVAGANITITTNAGTDTITIAATGSTGVNSVTGTANRITITGTAADPIVDIAATYVGQTSITTLGTIGTGTWQGTVVASGFIATALTGKTYNGLTLTSTTGTFTLTNGKTISVSNTMTFTATDGSTIAFGAGGTVLYASSTIPLTVGTTTIASGTTTRVLYDNAGVLGEYTISGSGNVAMTTSPSFTTPTLGVATATTINGNTFTTGTYTLTGAAAKTLTFSNSITLAGTDATTMTFPTTTATIARTDAAQTFTGTQTFSGTVALGTNSLTMTGSIAATGARVTKGWFTDLEISNPPTVAGVAMPTATSTTTFTNKRITKRAGTATSSGTPAINTDNFDYYSLTAQAANITSFTTNLTGTPTDAQTLWISIVGTGSFTIAWGASFEASTVALPTTLSTTRQDIGFVWNTVTSKWRIVALA